MSQHILVIDDDKQIVRLVRSYLEQAGYRVSVAYEGNEALQSIRADRPDLIVLDLILPGKDGWEITRIVRGDRTLAAIPIIMLTARAEDIDKIVGLELGADDYISKPFNPRELVVRVRVVLRRAADSMQPANTLNVGQVRQEADQYAVTTRGDAAELTPPSLISSTC